MKRSFLEISVAVIIATLSLYIFVHYVTVMYRPSIPEKQFGFMNPVSVKILGTFYVNGFEAFVTNWWMIWLAPFIVVPSLLMLASGGNARELFGKDVRPKRVMWFLAVLLLVALSAWRASLS
jgi:hypothetical protein